MSDETNNPINEESVEVTDALMSRLRVIEDQPLDERAEAFSQLYDELRRGLEGSDVSA